MRKVVIYIIGVINQHLEITAELQEQLGMHSVYWLPVRQVTHFTSSAL